MRIIKILMLAVVASALLLFASCGGCEHEDTEWQTVSKASCSKAGLREKVCEDCGEVVKTKKEKKLSHTLGDITTVKVVTCTEAGREEQICTTCRKVVYELDIQPEGHKTDSGWTITKYPTCTEAGREEQTCTVCYEVVNEREIESNGHTEDSAWTITKYPTCTEAGREEQTCTVCYEVMNEREIQPDGHKMDSPWSVIKNPTCTEPGREEQICAICSNRINEREIQADGHTSDSGWTITKYPTCTEYGEKVGTCSVCFENVESQRIEKEPHEFTHKITAIEYLKSEATTSSSAVYYYSCICGAKGEETFTSGDPVHVHEYTERNTFDTHLKSAATCKSAAVYYYSCSCGLNSSSTFTYGNKAEHVFDGTGYCNACGEYLSATEGVIYAKSSNGTYAEVTGYTGSSRSVVIARTYQGLPVKRIANSAFRGSAITDIFIPSSVTEIADFAFQECTALKSVILPEGLTRVSYSMFYDCYNLTSIVIPDSVKFVDAYAFYNCYNLTTVTVGSGVLSIGNYAFSTCYKISEVINKSSLNIARGDSNNGEIAKYAIEVHRGESKVVKKNDYRFYTYNGINYLVGYTGNSTEIILPESYNGQTYEIYKYAFYKCRSITSVTVSSGVTNIGNYAFSGCQKLVEVINKSGLDISVNTTENGQVARYAKVVHSGPGKIVNKNGYLFFSHEGENYLVGYIGDGTNLALPDSYNGQSYIVYDYAFYDCDGIVSVTVGENVTRIGERAFSNCDGLTSITVSKAVSEIGTYAFYDCYNLTDIKYRGTSSEWSNISKGANWDSSTGSYTVSYGYRY